MKLVANHRVSNVQRFKESSDNNTWIAIGGTAEWVDELNPPDEPYATSNVSTIIGIKKATLKWVVPDPAGSIVLLGPSGEERWREITNASQLLIEGCRWCLIQASIIGTELPAVPFRELGIYVGAVPAAGYESSEALLPENVTSFGTLQSIEYRQVVNRSASSTYVASTILEF